MAENVLCVVLIKITVLHMSVVSLEQGWPYLFQSVIIHTC